MERKTMDNHQGPEPKDKTMAYFPSLATLPRHIDAAIRIVRPAAVSRFITEQWGRCQTRRCMLVDDEYSIIRGI
jgi:hypothetical protein